MQKPLFYAKTIILLKINNELIISQIILDPENELPICKDKRF